MFARAGVQSCAEAAAPVVSGAAPPFRGAYRKGYTPSCNRRAPTLPSPALRPPTHNRARRRALHRNPIPQKRPRPARRAPGPNGSAPGKTASAPAAPANETRPSRQTAFAKTVAPYALAFLVPFAVVLAAFAASGIYPFGDVSVMLYDMPRNTSTTSDGSPTCCAAMPTCCTATPPGLGGGMFSLFSYYLASPFNLLAAFWQPRTCRNSSACCIC